MRLRRVAARDQYEQVIRLRIALRTNLCDRFWERFFQALEVVDYLGAGLRGRERLQFVAFFARELPNLRRPDADHRKRGVDLQSRKLVTAERVAHISQSR